MHVTLQVKAANCPNVPIAQHGALERLLGKQLSTHQPSQTVMATDRSHQAFLLHEPMGQQGLRHMTRLSFGGGWEKRKPKVKTKSPVPSEKHLLTEAY